MGIGLGEARAKFEAYLQARNHTPASIKNTLWHLDQWFKWLIQRGIANVTQMTQKEISDYLRHRFYRLNRNGKQDQPGTRNLDIAAIKSFFQFLMQQEYISENFADTIAYVKTSSLRLPKSILTKRELLKLFRQPDISTPFGYRDRLCFELLYATGMRRAELCDLKVNDIRFREETIYVEKGKGQKDRVVPVNKVCLEQTEYYIEHVRPLLLKPGKPTSRLILSCRGTSIRPEKLNDMLNKHIRKAKFKKKVTLHSLRHTVATHLIQKGMSLRHVQEFLGHAKLDSTMIYLNLSLKDLQREYRKCHPRERDV